MKLSLRERQVLNLLHYPTPTIAKKLTISIPTVKTYIQALFNKFPFANNRTQILIQALNEKIIKLEDLT